MSFLRPEAVAAVLRYAEPAIYAVLAGGFLWKGLSLIGADNWIGLALLVPGALAAFAALGTVERALVARRSARAGPGIVNVREGRISYFGPHGGATVAIDSLLRVDIVHDAGGSFSTGARWELTDEDGQRLSIPSGAVNASMLLDVLGGLPGFNNMAVVLAMQASGPNRREIWRRRSPAVRAIES